MLSVARTVAECEIRQRSGWFAQLVARSDWPEPAYMRTRFRNCERAKEPCSSRFVSTFHACAWHVLNILITFEVLISKTVLLRL